MERKIDEAAVWRRVNAAAGTAAVEPKAPMEQGPSLSEVLKTGRTLYEAYAGLSRGGRKLFGELAQGQRSENRLLWGIYYLQAGVRPRLSEQRQNPGGNYITRLRWLLELQGQQQEALETLSQQTGGRTGKLLRELSQKAEERWQRMLTELAGQLEKT